MSQSLLSIFLLLVFAALSTSAFIAARYRLAPKESAVSDNPVRYPTAVEAFFSLIDDQLVLLDAKNRVAAVTPQLAALLGTSPQTLKGLHLSSLTVDASSSDALFETGASADPTSIQLSGADGARPIILECASLFNSRGDMIGTLLKGRRHLPVEMEPYSIEALKPRWERLLENRTRDLELKNRELEASGTQLQELVERIGTTKDHEGIRISRVLREELTGILSTIRTKVDTLHDTLGSPFEQQVASVMMVIDTALDHVDKIIDGIRPPMLDRVGLGAAIDTARHNFEKVHHIACETHISINEEHIGIDLATAVFKVVQESLTNIARHSSASEATISLCDVPGGIRVAIEDNGRGIDPDALEGDIALGIVGMQERAKAFGGRLEVARRESGGTVIRMFVPIQR